MPRMALVVVILNLLLCVILCDKKEFIINYEDYEEKIVVFVYACLFSSLFFSLILRWGGNILPEFLMNFPVFSLLFQLSSALNKNMFDDVLISVFCGKYISQLYLSL